MYDFVFVVFFISGMLGPLTFIPGGVLEGPSDLEESLVLLGDPVLFFFFLRKSATMF